MVLTLVFPLTLTINAPSAKGNQRSIFPNRDKLTKKCNKLTSITLQLQTNRKTMPTEHATDETINRASALICAGDLVAFPTETVYGLGADATSDQAVAKVFAAKGRPDFNPLIVHVPDIATAGMFAVISEDATALAKAFWPGPLTIIMAKKSDTQISARATAGLDTVAIRCPGHPVALKLLQKCGRPIVAPSANRSGHVSPTNATHVAEDLGESLALIIDGGPTSIGLESTVITLVSFPKILRPGAISQMEIENILGPLNAPTGSETTKTGKIISPGQLASHYAPETAIRLNTNHIEPDEALLAFGPNPVDHEGPMINLSPDGNLDEAAANLFASLRTLDKSGCATIAVMPIPDQGLGEAINDRLKRAAAPRNI